MSVGAIQDAFKSFMGLGRGGPQFMVGSSESADIDFVNKEYKRRQEERRPFELQWRLNIAFIEGNQYIDINPVAMTIDEIPKLYWWQEREVFNHIAPNVEVRIAKLSRMRPMLKTRPGTNAQEDIRSSKIGTQLLKNTYNELNMQSRMLEAYAWAEACGSVIFKNFWNPNKGRVIAIYNDEEIREGDVDQGLCPAPEIFPDSNYHQNIEDCRSLIHAKAFHIDEIEEQWGVRVDPEETTVMQLQRTLIGTGGLGYGQGGFQYTTMRLKEHALVKEYWEIPTKRFPRGRLIVVANNKLLYRGDLPFRVGEDGKLALSFTKLDLIVRPGVFWGRTVVERAIPIQRRYNALRNRKAEYLARAAIGQWAVEEGAVDREFMEQEAGAPGAVLYYKRGFSKPEMVQAPPLPAAFETEEHTLMMEFSSIFGVSELSRQSAAPVGVKSGVALSIALEQDDTRLSSTQDNIINASIQNGKQWLRLYKQFAQGMRTLRDVGKDNVVEVMDWQASDICSDDVIVEDFSALAESPAQRRQLVFDLLQAGLFNDPDTGRIDKEMRSKVFEMIEIGNWETADDADQLHASKSERENRLLVRGSMPQAVNYDDHFIHIKRHNKFRLTTDYEELVAQNPQVDQIFQAHVDMHLNFMLQSIQAQAQAQARQAAGGGVMGANPA